MTRETKWQTVMKKWMIQVFSYICRMEGEREWKRTVRTFSFFFLVPLSPFLPFSLSTRQFRCEEVEKKGRSRDDDSSEENFMLIMMSFCLCEHEGKEERKEEEDLMLFVLLLCLLWCETFSNIVKCMLDIAFTSHGCLLVLIGLLNDLTFWLWLVQDLLLIVFFRHWLV
jgi:hypothetical protein